MGASPPTPPPTALPPTPPPTPAPPTPPPTEASALKCSDVMWHSCVIRSEYENADRATRGCGSTCLCERRLDCATLTESLTGCRSGCEAGAVAIMAKYHVGCNCETPAKAAN